VGGPLAQLNNAFTLFHQSAMSCSPGALYGTLLLVAAGLRYPTPLFAVQGTQSGSGWMAETQRSEILADSQPVVTQHRALL
jgi:hypothetical protein